MIVTDVAHLPEQVGLTPALQKALDFLRACGSEPLPDGRIEIDGAEVYALVQSYETKDNGEWLFEGHRQYLDVQYMLSGEEVIGWASSEAATVTSPYDPANDAWLGTVPAAQVTPVRLISGQLAVLYPSDAHAPRHAAVAPAAVKKIVIKVARRI
jgi:YhcH/YjgK/YiaL family protein